MIRSVEIPVCFVENLTLRSWALSIWPRIFCGRPGKTGTAAYCYVIDGKGWTVLLAKASAWLIRVKVLRLMFSAAEMRDESGLAIQWRIVHDDLAQVEEDAMDKKTIQVLGKTEPYQDRLPMYLSKNGLGSDTLHRGTTRRSIFLIQLCLWEIRKTNYTKTVPVLFLEHRPWLEPIKRYASSQGVDIVAVRPSLDLRAALRRRLPIRFMHFVRHVRYRGIRGGVARQAMPAGKSAGGTEAALSSELPQIKDKNPMPLVAVDYIGHLNLNRPARHSNLFFWQQSSLGGSDLLLAFWAASCPLDNNGLAELSEHGISSVVTHPGATTVEAHPVFSHRYRPERNRNRSQYTLKGGVDPRWLAQETAEYERLRAYWVALFAAHNVKVYVTYNKFEAAHCAIFDALQSLGGVTVNYQRSYETHPSPDFATYADVGFSFSHEAAEVERRSGSRIRYHVVTGYLGDHRFAALGETAQTARRDLKRTGAKHILAYLDENSSDDFRWASGHRFMQEDYIFLLEKVISKPWLGLILKPKTPSTLRRRLGPVAELLQKAQATGRCYLFEEGPLQASYPPAAAALAADVTIHGRLYAATAGVEAALAGAPTILLDREGWPASPFNRLGVGRVVFTDWEGLWEACLQHWASPEGLTGFGDWSPMLDELDPFRDGRAAERMGTYIKWLIEGFKAGSDREKVMADAADRYCALWGADKITQINWGTDSSISDDRMSVKAGL